MISAQQLMTENIELWTSAIAAKSSSGRGSSSKRELYGIKKLRELILELAVRGKLVPQDPSDEAASVLVDEVLLTQARLIEEEGLRTKAALEIGELDKYLEVPSSWQFMRLGNLAKFIDYRGKTPKKIESGVRLITAKNVRFGYISLEPEEFISGEEYDSWMTRGFPRRGDLLFTPEAPLGNVAIIDLEAKFALAQRAICFQLHEPKTAFFLKLVIMSPAFQNQLQLLATGMTAKGIKASKLKEIPVPLPSLSEQHRIVAKVDELMALCDQLEQQTESSLDAHVVLVDTLLATLTNSADANELAANWICIADHFDTLFNTEQSIDALKQTVLQLAVMGKLVPQDSNDEPASELLERIAAEKTQLVFDKKIKKPKALPVIAEDEKPFELPQGWEWCRVSEVAMFTTSGSRDWAKHYSEHGAIFVTMGNLSRGSYELRMDTIRYVCPPAGEEGTRTRLEANDLLISITGDVGNLGRVPAGFGEAYINQHTCLLRFMPSCQDRYFAEFMRSPCAKEQFDAPQRGIKNSFRLGDVGLMVMALPPVEERDRIVAKVDQLMTLCDQLKQRLYNAQQIQLNLAGAIIEKALKPLEEE